MSIEYFARMKVDSAVTEGLARQVQADTRFRILDSADPRRLLLQLTRNPPRSEWPEDIEIQFQPDGIYVAFHSATRDDRADVVEFLESTLDSLGSPAKFLED